MSPSLPTPQPGPRPTLTLITGGARSGKSRLAQQRAAARQSDVLMIATAEPHDEDMAARIARHRRERPPHWRTLETPRHIARTLAQDEATPPPVIILDCVTLWVTNLLLSEGSTWESAAAELDALLAWHRSHPCEMIVVTNEVGLGIVPPDEVSRTFREWLGWFNQRLATEADEVYLMVAGLAVEIKALSLQPSLPDPRLPTPNP
ncbi:MAG: bifunctional adenosylcobinamide kinase/adenosylcobinamide-phosphate guanylyltransferase [Chloroflexaceae bacterium]|nr:bifunctional adenosylcobinamide kinase/adenosylcobinamide-phosphate guanylyltransferase [Chloroflexaceae bacterium]